MHTADKRLNVDVIVHDHPSVPPPAHLVGHFAEHVRAAPGKFVVLMDKSLQPDSPILVAKPRGDFARYKATVVAAGSGVGLKTGDRILVRPKVSKQVLNFALKGVKSWPHETRFFGAFGGRPMDMDYGDTGVALLMPWWDAVACKLCECDDPSVCRYEAVGDSVVVWLPPLKSETAGGLILTESAQRRSCVGKIVSVGEEAQKSHPLLQVGQGVVFSEGAARRIYSPSDPEDGSGHATVPSEFVLAVVPWESE